ncbi:tRNA (adenosine(37)-N6)-threonylcarbamoyltransferase complex dimerization subunit type 1 TsaB [Candidatus Peregrinibacteria bacterium CG10_big_fil_rev_8_21_14_0_10_36_19]|nr:MAG: tRNA (adenosine(37)-N6)-threonylcarbamoyltransferase complex dimerization subunit type 1 TsaB [Candidatus Peregrinibacteria bacterium CG10_big_fil_rev_8_21_14_0_10_36_19]
MLTLAINTASSNTEIALLMGDQVLAEKSWPSANGEAEKLMPEINALITPHAFQDIKRVVVIKGPGSFTGLRVGVTVANTLAYLNSAKLNAISTFDYWHAKAPNQTATLVTFAGKGGIYINDGDVLNLSEANDYFDSQNITEIYGDITEDQKMELTPQHLKSDKKFGETVLKIISENNLEDLKIVKPLYVKPPNISKSKKL